MSPHRVWRQTATEHRRWLFWNAIVIAAAVNAALSALIAWGSAVSEERIPLWAIPLVEGPSTITDTVGTFFVLPFLTTLAVTTVAWRELRDGRIAPLSAAQTLFWRLPPTRLRRALRIGAVCVAILAPPAVVALIAVDFGDITVGDFVVYKALLGVALGAIVTPLIALAAMTDDVRSAPGA